MIVVGNRFGKSRKNFFAGIRAPWTLAGDKVWARTLRVAGWLFEASGLIIALTALVAPVKAEPVLRIGAVVLSVLIPYAGAYFIFHLPARGRFCRNGRNG